MIQPRYLVLEDLLERRLFRIPDYQRAYSWETRQREDLFSDIEKLIARRRADYHHFLSTVVCIKTSEREAVGTREYEVLHVVDGQQRLTTLIILLKAISKRLLRGTREEKDEAETLERLLVKGSKELVLIQTNHDTSMLCSTFLRTGGLPEPEAIRTHSDRLLANAITECETFVGRARDLMSLLRILRNRLGFVLHELTEEGDAYTVFEVLNSRGLPVDPLDKCKSSLMEIAFEHAESRAAQERVKEVHGHWKEVYAALGLSDVSTSEVLRFAATLHTGSRPNRTMPDDEALDHFRNHCSEDPEEVDECCRWILRTTRALVRVQGNPRLKAVTRVAHARLLAVAIELSDAFEPGSKELASAMKQWENVTFRVFGMLREQTRKGVGEFTRLAWEIVHLEGGNTSDWEIIASLLSLGHDYPIAKAVSALANADCYKGWEEELRYFMFRYEEHLAELERAEISQEAWHSIWSNTPSRSIEHICPQASTASMEPHIHRLGNLVLLTPNLNSRASNKPFDDKKKLYQKAQLRIVQELLESPDWKRQDIDRREKRLLEFASVCWADVPAPTYEEDEDEDDD